MIGVINPNATHAWEAQHQFAMTAPYDLKPGETWKAEDRDHGKPSSTPAPSTKPEEGGGKKSGLGAGVIAGIAIGSAAVVVIAAALLYVAEEENSTKLTARASFSRRRPPLIPLVLRPWSKHSTTTATPPILPALSQQQQDRKVLHKPASQPSRLIRTWTPMTRTEA